MGTNFRKDHTFYTCADNDGSIFSLCDPEKHRERRKILSPRFSKQAAEMDAPKALRKLQELLEFMVGQSRQGKSCNITDLFRALGVCSPMHFDLEALSLPRLTYSLRSIWLQRPFSVTAAI
jgi:hypothetical protein